MGFIVEQQLFVTGRIKDLIIVAGKNYYPQVGQGACCMRMRRSERVPISTECASGGSNYGSWSNLQYIVEQQLLVTGCIEGLIIIAGKNYYPQVRKSSVSE